MYKCTESPLDSKKSEMANSRDPYPRLYTPLRYIINLKVSTPKPKPEIPNATGTC